LEIILTQVGLTENRQYLKHIELLLMPETNSRRELRAHDSPVNLPQFLLSGCTRDWTMLRHFTLLGHAYNCRVFLQDGANL